MPAISLTSLNILRFLKTNGLSTRAEIKAGVADLPGAALNNLMRVRLIAQDMTDPNAAAIARRTSLPENMVRPAINALVQRGDLANRPTTPPTYRATKKHSAADPVARARNQRNTGYPTGYTCPELARNPGLPAARFAAFALPSRVGNWLHYPDGRREPFPTRQPATAQATQAAQAIEANPYSAQVLEAA